MTMPKGPGEDTLQIGDDQAAEELIAELRNIKNPNQETIVGHPRIKTVAQIIDAVEKRTPDGLEFIRLYKQVKELENKPTEGIVDRIKKAIRQIF